MKKTTPKRVFWILFMALILGVAFVILSFGKDIILSLRLFLSEPLWNLDYISESLRTSIPNEATNINIDGQMGHLSILKLSFQAPAEATIDFAENLCNGSLYPHFDPFNAIYVAESPSYEYAVTLQFDGEYTSTEPFYSYSPAAKDTDLGNWCRQDGFALTLFRIDTSIADLYTVQLYYSPSSFIYGPFDDASVDVKIDGSPILLRGLRQNRQNGHYFVSGVDHICLEIDPLNFLGDRQQLELLEAQAEISINGGAPLFAYISEDGFLTISGGEANNDYFTICPELPASASSYDLQIRLQLTNATEENYIFSFDRQ